MCRYHSFKGHEMLGKQTANLLANAVMGFKDNFMLRGLQSSGCCG